MKTNNINKSSYSETTAQQYIKTDKPVQSVSSFIEVQYEYLNNQRTNNIKGYKLWFIQEGLNPFSIKFENKPDLPKFLSLVEFENLQGIEIRSNVYFKADSVKVVK